MRALLTNQLSLKDFRDRITKEGRLINLRSRSIPAASPAAVAYNASGGGGGTFYVPPGKNWWVQSINSSCSGPFYWDCSIGQGRMSATSDAFAGVTSSISSIFPGISNRRCDILLGEQGYIQSGFVSYTATNTPATSVDVMGIEFTADYDFDAKYNVLLISDSIGWSNIGNDASGSPFSGDDLYLFRIKKALEAEKGRKFHVINKGFGGSYSTNAVNAVKSRDYEGILWDLLIIQLGTNDASLGAATATFTDNINYIIANTKKNPDNENASVVLLGPPVTDVANRVSNIASYRTALSAIANPSLKKYYADLSTAFSLAGTASADTNFTNGSAIYGQSTERAAGNRLHPSGDGHGLMSTVIMNTIRNTAFYTNI